MPENPLRAAFPYRVGLHQSCYGQRGLHLSQMSELVAAPYSEPRQLLNVKARLVPVILDRADECGECGNMFCMAKEVVSAKMGKDHVTDRPLEQRNFS